MIREFTAYYATYVGLREDYNPYLIWYPYYPKSQEPGDSSFTRHIDLNIPRLIAHHKGEEQKRTLHRTVLSRWITGEHGPLVLVIYDTKKAGQSAKIRVTMRAEKNKGKMGDSMIWKKLLEETY